MLRQATEIFRVAQADITNINVGLMFKDIVPSRKEHQPFMVEVATFIRACANQIGENDGEFWPQSFTTPLMARYLRTIYLRRDEYAVWHSNITAGYIALPDSTLTSLVGEKAEKAYRATSELWLV